MAGALLLAASVPASAGAAEKSAKIDFEAIQEGSIVSQVSSGAGMSGEALTGHVGVFGDSPKPAIVTNAAIIFDATCSVDGAGGTADDCSGNEDTLWNPPLGNVLIMADNLRDANGNGRIDDPNSSDLPNTVFTFDFTTLETGLANVGSVDLMDIDTDEQPATIELFRGGASIGSVPVPSNGDNTATTVPVGLGMADTMRITLQGSGAIDNVTLTVGEPDPVQEGCSYAFWKPHIDAWLSRRPVLKLFVGLLRLRGGVYYTLAQETAAALLNANDDRIDFPLDTAAVLDITRAAVADRDPASGIEELRALNGGSCPLD